MTGYESKRAAAQAIDEVNWADHEPNGLAQPAQEPVAWLTRDSVDGCWYATAKKVGKDDKPLYATPPRRTERTEQNFCSRCGKRTQDIHTCTPPSQEFNT